MSGGFNVVDKGDKGLNLTKDYKPKVIYLLSTYLWMKVSFCVTLDYSVRRKHLGKGHLYSHSDSWAGNIRCKYYCNVILMPLQCYFSYLDTCIRCVQIELGCSELCPACLYGGIMQPILYNTWYIPSLFQIRIFMIDSSFGSKWWVLGTTWGPPWPHANHQGSPGLRSPESYQVGGGEQPLQGLQHSLFHR